MKLANLAWMTTASTGAGTITLNGTKPGYLSFAAAGLASGDTVSYTIVEGNNREAGFGTYTAGTPATLTRNPVTSTNGNAAISLAGTAEVVVTALAHDLVTVPAGSCLLAKVGANLVLNRHGGDRLFIEHVNRPIQAIGPTLPATGLTAFTLYYVYAFWTGSAVAIEASTTAPAEDAIYGHRIKTGDRTRSLVGMARPVTGPAWDGTPLLVRSWFNRTSSRFARIFDETVVGSDQSLSGPLSAWTEVNTNFRTYFLAWADETFAVDYIGGVEGSAVGSTIITGVGFDGAPADRFARHIPPAVNTFVPCGISHVVPALSEGLHYATLMGYFTAGVATWAAGGCLQARPVA